MILIKFVINRKDIIKFYKGGWYYENIKWTIRNSNRASNKIS